MNELRCIASGVGYYFTMWKNAYILDFYETPTVEGLDASVACKRIALRKNPGGLIVLNLIDGENPPPSGPIRRYAQTKSTEDPDGVLCHATIIRGEGFKSATIRSMLATIQLVTRAPYPRKVFATNEEAASWAGPLAGAPLPKQLLVEALRATREKGAMT